MNYHTPAFGILQSFFHIQMLDSRFEEIFPIQDPNNTILGLSDIYVSRDIPNEYFGIFYVPTQDITTLEYYIQHQQRENRLKIKKFLRVSTVHRNISLQYYSVDKGWLEISSKQLKNCLQLTTDDKENQFSNQSSSYYLSPDYNTTWQFKSHQLPLQIIQLYCKVPVRYSFINLPLGLSPEEQQKKLSTAEIGLLKQLNYNHVLNIDWVPRQLIREFSLDYYWLEIPKIPFQKLIPILKLLPFSTINFSESSFFLWTHLTPQLLGWIKNNLNWKIHPVFQYHSSKTPD